MKLLAVLIVPLLAGASILPDTIGAYHRTAVTQPTLNGRDLWDEYGLHEYESATYQNDAAKFTATAYQLQDSTGAMAAFHWQRPATAKVSRVADYAAETGAGLILVRGNFLLAFDGYKPEASELAALEGSLIHVDGTPFPTLPGFLPAQDLIPNSERYITGPMGLQMFDPAIPPSVAAFHFGTEATFGVFHSPKGDLKLAVFNYPTPQIAMDRVGAFQNLPGAVAKRSGPLVAVVVSPPDADEAERLLAQVQYRADITQQEHIPTRRDNIGNLVVNAFILAGILLVFCVVGGLGVGGMKVLRRRGKNGEDGDAMITLHLE
ncbi:MAG: DUF6599 family protein [Bryobacteraceae bacterium]|jgi:hypothetical protein